MKTRKIIQKTMICFLLLYITIYGNARSSYNSLMSICGHKPTIEEATSESSLVFIAKATSYNRAHYLLTLKVNRVFKENIPQELQVYSPSGQSNAYPLSLDHEYLIFTSGSINENHVIFVSECSRTNETKNAKSDLEWLKNNKY